MNPHLNGVHMNGLNMNRIKTERCEDGKISVHVDVQQNLMAPLFKSMKQKEQILNSGGLPLKETFSPTRKFRCMFPLKNKFSLDNTFPYKQSSLFFKSYFPLQKVHSY